MPTHMRRRIHGAHLGEMSTMRHISAYSYKEENTCLLI
jgi:hypothetical protein